MIIEGAYLVAADSPIQRNDEVDRDGVRVAVGKGQRIRPVPVAHLKHAQIVYAPTSPAVTDLFVAQKLDVAAGVKQQLQADAKRLPGLRVLDGRFMVIQQAMATQRGRPAAAAYLNKFVEEMKASGLIEQALARQGIQGAAVAPPARHADRRSARLLVTLVPLRERESQGIRRTRHRHACVARPPSRAWTRA